MNDIIVFGNITTWLKYNFWWILILLVLLLVLFGYIRLQRKPKIVKPKSVEDDQILSIIESYGGINNIKAAFLDGKRLKVELKSLDLLDIERFESYGASGIFISGNHIKMVLPYDMQKLVDKINNEIDGGKS